MALRYSLQNIWGGLVNLTVGQLLFKRSTLLAQSCPLLVQNVSVTDGKHMEGQACQMSKQPLS